MKASEMLKLSINNTSPTLEQLENLMKDSAVLGRTSVNVYYISDEVLDELLQNGYNYWSSYCCGEFEISWKYPTKEEL